MLGNVKVAEAIEEGMKTLKGKGMMEAEEWLELATALARSNPAGVLEWDDRHVRLKSSSKRGP